jgi:transcriptional regulator with XRE-family HTH domain
MAHTRIDVASLYAALDKARISRDLSWRQLAGEVGISPSTLSRLANDHNPDVTAFASMVSWLRMPAEQFMIDESRQDNTDQSEPDLVASLAPLLRARKDLNEEDVEHLEELIASAVRRFTADRSKS